MGVLTVLLGVGGVLGVAEIAAPAIAKQLDAVAASGWLLAAFAGGSALGGLLYGQLDLKSGIGARLFTLCVSMGLAAVLVSQLDTLGFFTAGIALVGLFLARLSSPDTSSPTPSFRATVHIRCT